MWWPFPLPNVVCFAQSRARAFGIQYTSSRMVASAHGKAVAPISKPGPGDFRAAIPATPGSGSSVVGYGFGTLDQPVRPGNFRRSRTHVGPADDALERTGDIAAPGDHRLVKRAALLTEKFSGHFRRPPLGHLGPPFRPRPLRRAVSGNSG